MSYYFSPNPSIKYNTRYLSPVAVILSWFKPFISCCHKGSVGQFMFPLKKWVRQFANHGDLPSTIFCWPDSLLAQQFANLTIRQPVSLPSQQFIKQTTLSRAMFAMSLCLQQAARTSQGVRPRQGQIKSRLSWIRLPPSSRVRLLGAIGNLTEC